MALSESSSAVLQESLQEFQLKFHSKVPLDIPHCSQFLDETKIQAVALQERLPVWRKFMQKLSKLPNPDFDTISGIVNNKFDSSVSELVQESIAKHREYKDEAESLHRERMERICDDVSDSIQNALLAKSDMGANTLEEILQKSKSRGIAYFEIYNEGGIWNGSFFDEQMEKFKTKLDKLHEDIVETHRQCLDGHFGIEDESWNPTSDFTEHVKFEGVIIGNENGDFGIESNLARNFKLSNQTQTETLPDGLEEIKNWTSEDEVEIPIEYDSGMDWTMTDVINTSAQTPLERGGERRQFQIQGAENMNVVDDYEIAAKRTRHDATPTPTPGPSTRAESPLVVRLGSDNISIGTMHYDRFTKARGYFPPSLAVDQNGYVVCGVEALNCQERFSLDQCLVGGTTGSNLICFKRPNGDWIMNQEVSLEFLLGVMLKSLKEIAETRFQRQFHSAVIIIPIWFHSVQRIQVKDAAVIAGFAEVHLINQESLAVHAYWSSVRNRYGRDECNIMVLVENFGIISAIRYHDTGYKTGGKRLAICKEGDDYCSIEEDKDTDPDKRMSKIIALSRCFRDRIFNSDTVVEAVLYVTDSSDWELTFQEFARKYGYDVEASSLSQMFGGSILASRNDVLDVYEAIRERSTCLLEPCSVEPPIWLPMQVRCELPIHSFREVNNGYIFQTSVKPDRPIVLGRLEFNGIDSDSQNGFVKCKVILTFSINLDATVSLVNIDVEKLRKSKNTSRILLPEEFAWKPANLGDGDRDNLKEIVNSILVRNQLQTQIESQVLPDQGASTYLAHLKSSPKQNVSVSAKVRSEWISQ